MTQLHYHLTAFHIVLLTTKAFIIPWDKLSYSQLTSVHVLCYQLLCHSCFLLTVIFKTVVTKILVQHGIQMIMAKIPLI